MLRKNLSIALSLCLILSLFNFTFAQNNGKGPKDETKAAAKELKAEEKLERLQNKIIQKNEVQLKNALRKELDEDCKNIKTQLKLLEQMYKESLEDDTDLDENSEDVTSTDDEENSDDATNDDATDDEDESEDLSSEDILSQIKEMQKSLQRTRQEIKNRIRQSYSTDELENIDTLREELESLIPDITVLDVDSIINTNGNFKFDVPPVIKGGRTLIPVRAISEGFGAEVTWNQEDNSVTITKDDTTIVIIIGENKAIVNGEEVVLDAKAEVMSNRTIVPMRFIAETLGLQVDWDEETETIELSDDTDDTDTQE